MNDTLDNFNFSQNVFSNDHNKENVLKGKVAVDSGVFSNPDTEISFDDSLFLSESIAIPLVFEKNNVAGLNNTNLAGKIDTNSNINNEIKQNDQISNGQMERNILQEKGNIVMDTKELSNVCDRSVLKGTSESTENTIGMVETVTISENISEDKNKDVISSEMYNLSSWDLPTDILKTYSSKNLNSMFKWQVECLCNQNVLKNYKNLIYSAPTSAGKTLVAEILAIKTVFERRKKVIFILPFVSIVREKMYYFQDLMGNTGIRVEGFMGSYNPPGGFSSVQIAICTIEKANNLINRLLEEGTLSDIGAILVDEVHLLGDPHRGYILELLLTKLIYISKKQDIKIQIIGMSATLPNLTILAKWLKAELYKTDFRPIPLYEQAVVGGDIFDVNFSIMRKLQPLPEIVNDTDNILQLCLETIKDSCSILIFCPTKNWCENLAQQIASAFLKIGK